MPSDMYIKFDGIPGEVTTDDHKEWIEVLSYSHGVSMAINESTVSAGSRSAGRANMQDFSFVKMMDKSSVTLNANCVTGKSIPTVTIDLTRAGEGKQEVFMTYTLSGVLISSISAGGSGGGGVPTENVSLAFGKIVWKYMPTSGMDGKQGSKQEATYDLTTLKKT